MMRLGDEAAFSWLFIRCIINANHRFALFVSCSRTLILQNEGGFN